MTTLNLQVSAGADDCLRIPTPDWWSITTGSFAVGYGVADYPDYGSAARFLNVTIPAGSIVASAFLKLTSHNDKSQTVVNTRLRAERNINPATFSTKGDFGARTWTTDKVNWDGIAAWVTDEEYTSPDIKALIQEVIDLAGWVSGNPIVILWDDFEKRSTQADNTQRFAYSYNGSSSKAPILIINYSVAFIPKLFYF